MWHCGMVLIGVLGNSLLYSVVYSFVSMGLSVMALAFIIGNSLPYSDGNR